jgi:hypothetical protein
MQLNACSRGSIHIMWEGSFHVETEERRNFDKLKKRTNDDKDGISWFLSSEEVGFSTFIVKF